MIDLPQCSLGMELGSTRIKAVLIDAAHTPLAQGEFTWENRLQNGIWTYPLEEVRQGVQAAYAALALGLDILKQENVALDILLGHGGIFKTPGVAQRYLAAAAGVPVTCLETAGEGGPYGMALLAAYRLHRRDGETLADYLQTRVFAGAAGETVTPSPADKDGFAAFLAQYKTALQAERALID